MDAERKYTYQEFQSNKSNSRSLWKVIKNVVPSKSQEKHVYSKDLKTVAIKVLLFVFKAIHSIAPSYISDLIALTIYIHHLQAFCLCFDPGRQSAEGDTSF